MRSLAQSLILVIFSLLLGAILAAVLMGCGGSALAYMSTPTPVTSAAGSAIASIATKATGKVLEFTDVIQTDTSPECRSAGLCAPGSLVTRHRLLVTACGLGQACLALSETVTGASGCLWVDMDGQAYRSASTTCSGLQTQVTIEITDEGFIEPVSGGLVSLTDGNTLEERDIEIYWEN